MENLVEKLREALFGYPKVEDATHWNNLRANGLDLISLARENGAKRLADIAWHLTEVAGIRADFCDVFTMMKSVSFREAWVALEQVEIAISTVLRNQILPDEFGISELAQMVSYWQSLFPYTLFLSPEILVREQECSICGVKVSPMRSCEHKPGMVYEGVLCSRLLKKLQLLTVSIVRDPVQKYSVLIPEDDPHDYAEIKFVMERLRGPFSRWRLTQTKILYNHNLFKDWAPEGNCPCRSGFTYATCCALEAGVLLPHSRVEIEEPPSGNLPQFLFRRRSREDGELE